MWSFYARPDPDLAVQVTLQPQLASWNKLGDPERDRLERYLDHVHARVSDRLAESPLALALDVGLGTGPLVHEYDLDNFLHPVLHRLGADRFCAAFARKLARDYSTIAVEPARLRTPAGPTRPPDLVVAPTGSYEKRPWLVQIEEACAEAQRLDPDGSGPVRLVIVYDLGPERNWTTLWKPTIDALGPLLGTVPRPQKDHDDPRDGRITELELHRNIDPQAGRRVRIAFWWDLIEPAAQG